MTKNITIGIDGNEANAENRVGVNTYALELLWGLYELEDDSKKYVIYLKNAPNKDLPQEKTNWHYKVLGGSSLWIITKLMPTLFFENDKPDVFFEPSHYVPLLAPQPRVCAIMDLGYLKFSEHLKKYDFWQLTLWSAYSMLVAKYIFAISQSTKQEIITHYPFTKDKVVVTPLAYDPKLFNHHLSKDIIRQVVKKYGITGEYILFLSTLKPSKNVEGLVSAWKEAVKGHPDLKLVIAGKKGWLYEEIFRKVRDFSLEESIIFTDYVAEKDKPYLIAGSKLFVLPSFWEGFGIDALNAMAVGVPVVVSDQGSLPEVVGKAGILVDPYQTKSIAAGIEKVLSLSEKDYNELVKKGLQQASKFSWQETAKRTLEVLEKAVK